VGIELILADRGEREVGEGEWVNGWSNERSDRSKCRQKGLRQDTGCPPISTLIKFQKDWYV
jgi:hypothetical protein